MRKFLSICFSTFFVFLISGCGSSQPAPNTKIIPIDNYQPEKGNGVLYLIREEAMVYGAVDFSFYIDDQYIGMITNESAYYVVELSPGTHTYKRVISDFTGETPLQKRIQVNKDYAQMFIYKGGWGVDAPFDSPALKNHKFLGYQKIGNN